MTTATCSTTSTEGIATITLNRPERLNAISGGMLASLSHAFRAADRDRDVRAIILTGAGRGFCAGLDLKDRARTPTATASTAPAAACPRSSTCATRRRSCCTRWTSR